MSVKILSGNIPNIPWQERPSGSEFDVIWRYSGNPVIGRHSIPSSNSIFNCAVTDYEGGFIGIFRCDYRDRFANLHLGRSKDGVNWEIEPERIRFTSDDPEINADVFAYDPRLCRIGKRYYITWCNAYKGVPVIALGYTDNFTEFYQLDNVSLPFNRNGVLFPKTFGGNYLMLSRPSDNGHTPFGDIYISESPDLCYWGHHRLLMSRRGCWEGVKIGAGPVPIETSEGWLLLYHGVLHSCNGYVYSVGGALLDLENPRKVIFRSRPYLLSPQAPYECAGDVPNVTFPCAALADSETGRICIYYGCADTVTGLAFGQVEEIVEYIKSNSTL